jgi:hypothetical protein
MRRARAAVRWGIISLIGVAMAAFIVFDVLDLDGSNLRRSTNGGALTSDPPGSETERLIFRTAEPMSAPESPPSVTRLSLPSHSGVTRPVVKPRAVPAHRTVAHLLAKRDALHGTPSSPGDPA